MNVYLDNSATTQCCPEAVEAARLAMAEAYGNPSSTHGPGRKAAALLKQSRAVIAATLCVSPEELYFTSCGSEADNWAITCGAAAQKKVGKHIISSYTEHEAVLKSLERLEQKGWEVTRLNPREDGAVHPEDVADALREDTALISLMHVNNETGAITDIAAVAALLKQNKSRALLHTDAVQSYMKVPFTAKKLGADMITISAHKIHAPKGTGALYIRRGVHLQPFIVGGGQESRLRSGTEGIPGICAFAAAAKSAYRELNHEINTMENLRKKAIENIKKICPECVIIGGGAPHILCVSFPGYRSEVLLNYLDAKNVYISKGSACKRGARSHVLQAMELPAGVIDSAVRISLSRFTTEEEIDAFLLVLQQALQNIMKT